MRKWEDGNGGYVNTGGVEMGRREGWKWEDGRGGSGKTGGMEM